LKRKEKEYLSKHLRR